MQLRLLGAVLYYLGPTGRQGTVDLGPCLASHKVHARHASTCYLTVYGITYMATMRDADSCFYVKITLQVCCPQAST